MHESATIIQMHSYIPVHYNHPNSLSYIPVHYHDQSALSCTLPTLITIVPSHVFLCTLMHPSALLCDQVLSHGPSASRLESLDLEKSRPPKKKFFMHTILQ